MSFEPRRREAPSFQIVREMISLDCLDVLDFCPLARCKPQLGSFWVLNIIIHLFHIRQSRGESAGRRYTRRPPLEDYSREVYEFLRRSFEKEEEICTCHQYLHNPQSPRRTRTRLNSPSALACAPHQRGSAAQQVHQHQQNAKRRGHRRSVSYAGHIIVDKPFVSERMGNAQAGGEIKSGKRDKPSKRGGVGGGGGDKRAPHEAQVRFSSRRS